MKKHEGQYYKGLIKMDTTINKQISFLNTNFICSLLEQYFRVVSSPEVIHNVLSTWQECIKRRFIILCIILI